jgi:hypothetical protein
MNIHSGRLEQAVFRSFSQWARTACEYAGDSGTIIPAASRRAANDNGDLP